MASEVKNFLNLVHPDYRDQHHVWTKMEDLYLGAEEVKAKRGVYLPTSAAEDDEITRVGAQANKRTMYDRRLENAVFFNGVDRLVKFVIGHLFRKPPTFKTGGPDWFTKLQGDCDLLGTPLIPFLRDIGLKAYLFGHYVLAVDFPNMTGVDSRSVEKIVNPRPFLIPVHPLEIINWSLSRSLDGSYQYDWLVHRYTYSESTGPDQPHYRAVYYKVWYRDRWELYKIVMDKGDLDLDSYYPEQVDGGPNPLGMVPYVPIYSQMIRPMVSKPPLLEAANLNIDHYRQLSAFIHGLRYHLSPILVLSGTQNDTNVRRDAATAMELPRGATAEYVETQGHGLEIAMKAADMIAQEMWDAGLRGAEQVGANTSADARRIARSDFYAWLLSVTNSYENAFKKVCEIAGLWARDNMPGDDFPIALNKDFDVTTLDANGKEFLLNARKAGEISKKLFLKELIRGDTLREDLDIDQELLDAQADLDKDLEALAKAEAASAAAQGLVDKAKAGGAAEGTPALPVRGTEIG